MSELRICGYVLEWEDKRDTYNAYVITKETRELIRRLLHRPVAWDCSRRVALGINSMIGENAKRKAAKRTRRKA